MNDGFRVVRIIRFAADDQVYPTATEASEAQHRLAVEHPDREYAIAHTTYPLEADPTTAGEKS